MTQADDMATPTGQALTYYRNAWASMIEDGRIVATDYAPDSGWLDRDS